LIRLQTLSASIQIIIRCEARKLPPASVALMKNSAYIFVKRDHRKFQLSENLLVSSLVLSVGSQGKIQLKHVDIDPTRSAPARRSFVPPVSRRTSLPGLARQSIRFAKGSYEESQRFLRRRWTRGSSPRVTESPLLRLPTTAAST